MRRTRLLLAAATAVTIAGAAGGYALAAGGFSDVTFSGCLAGGKLAQVQVTRTPSCSSSATPVQWAGQAAVSPSPSPSTTSPSPSPTLTSPSPSPTDTSPSPTPTGTACVLTTYNGNCGPYDYPADTAASGFNTYVGPDFFSPLTGEKTTLTVTDPGHWDDLVTAADGNTGVTGYPSTSQGASGDGTEQAITAYTQITSSFAENMNANPGTIAESAYDIWTDTNFGPSNETMIQFDFTAGRAVCTGSQVLATVAVAEPASGTVQDWQFCRFGNERIFQLADSSGQVTSEQSGSVDIQAMLEWEQSNGELPSTDRLGLVGFGTEICSTGGQPEDFTVSRFSLTALPNP